MAAEDNPTNQLVLTTLLAELELTVSLVGDGAQAVEAWRTGDYDVILMDMQTPVTDGLTATLQIRAEERTSGRARTPIIAFTADAMTHHLESYRRAGIDGWVTKPVQFTQLVEVLDQVLSGAAGEARQAA